MATVRSGKYAGRHGRVGKVFQDLWVSLQGTGMRLWIHPDELMTDYEVQKWGPPKRQEAL